MKRAIIVAFGVLVLACVGLGVAIIATFGGGDPPTFANPTETFSTKLPAVKTPATRASSADLDNMLGAGDYEVGSKTSRAAQTIKPGTYRIGSFGNCYWARLSGFSGELDDVIANGNIDSGKLARVTVKKTDKGLHLNGECLAQ